MSGAVAKRQIILDAAMRVFSAKGFHNAKIEEIAQEAEVGKGTVYEYFSNKEALFVEMLESAFHAYTEGLTQAVSAADGSSGRLHAMLKFSLSFIQQKQELARLMMEQPIGIPPRLKQSFAALQRRIRQQVDDILQEGVERGELREHDRNVAVAMVMGTVYMFCRWEAQGRNKVSIEQISRQAVDLLIGGLQSSR